VAEVVWTRRALADLTAIHAYVQQFAPLAAQRLALRLRGVADSLGEQPERGRSVGSGRREIVTVRPYLIRYRIVRDQVQILTIRHGARWPAP
jgi:addiction module RelE/StbE family toxin